MNAVKIFKIFSYLNVFLLPTWIITPLLATETTIFFLIYEGNYSDLFDLTPGNGNGQSILISIQWCYILCQSIFIFSIYVQITNYTFQRCFIFGLLFSL